MTKRKRTPPKKSISDEEIDYHEGDEYNSTSEEEDVFVFTKDGDAYVETKDKSGKKTKIQLPDNEDEIFDFEYSRQPKLLSKKQEFKNPFNKKEMKIYDNIVDNYEARNIKEEDIVRSNMSIDDKTDAYEIYRIIDTEFSNHGESENWLILRQMLYKKIKNATPITEADREALIKLDRITDAHISIPQKIARSDHPEEIKALIYKKYCEIKDLKHNDESYGKSMMWINKALDLPTKSVDLSTMYSDGVDLIHKVFTRLDNSIYGQSRVKEKIVETVSAMWANPQGSSKSMVFIGPPGVGKTAFAKSLAEGIGLPFYQISFGGNKDASILKGHDNVYVGATPGEIAEGLIKMGVQNGILFLDEIDKLTDGGQGTQDALLHILDPEQNSQFKDNFLTGIPLNLRKMIIIASVNSTEVFDGPLLNRLHLISFDSYSHDEKIIIGMNYIVPEVMNNLNMKSTEVTITKDSMSYLINKSQVEEPGVRQLIRNIRSVYERINTLKQIYTNNTNNTKKSKKRIKLSYDIPTFKIPFTLTNPYIDTLYAE